MTDRPDKPEIVQFDVGGRIFKTSRSLIDQHEDTMLARLMSDTWQEDPTKSVFIDRNGDIFSHILDYLRYGSITLPDKIVKDMFLRDLDFYGIVPEEGSVKSLSEVWASKIHDRYDKIIKLESEATTLKLENDIEFLANYCACKYIIPGNIYGGKCTIKVEYDKDGADKEKQMLWNAMLWNAAEQVRCHESNNEAFSKALMKFGLSLSGEGVEYKYFSRRSYYLVTVKSSK